MVSMRAASAALLALAACGRIGFQPAGDEGAEQKSDAAASVDAPTIDSAPGMGTVTITETTEPYQPLANGTVFPGFMAGVSDEDNYAIALPFTFMFYGQPFTTLGVSVNGYATLEFAPTNEDSYLNECPFDATLPNATIAVFWDDLVATMKAPQGLMHYVIRGTAPSREVVVEWREMDAYYQQNMSAFTQGMRVTHMLVLKENGAIELRYGPRTAPTKNEDCGAQRHRGCSATIGIEGPAGTPRELSRCGTATGAMGTFQPIDEGLVIRYTPM